MNLSLPLPFPLSLSPPPKKKKKKEANMLPKLRNRPPYPSQQGNDKKECKRGSPPPSALAADAFATVLGKRRRLKSPAAPAAAPAAPAVAPAAPAAALTVA